MSQSKPKLVYIVTEDWYFCSHRLPIARAARDAGFDVIVATRVGHDGARIEREGFKLVPLGMRRSERRPWRELRTIFDLLRLFRQERPDLVHLVAVKPILYGSIAARLASVPAIVNAFAGLGYLYASDRADASLLRGFLKLAFRRILSFPRSFTIVQNSDDKHELRLLGVPNERISVIHGSGVDIHQFIETPELIGKPVATFVSRMLWDKGVGELVEAARILKCSHPLLRVRLVGLPDPENPTSIPLDRLREWHDEGVIEWFGASDDVPDVWAQSHIAVLPSYREGLPKTLLEAAACGRPLVASDVPGCREIVRHGENGLLVPPRSPRELARAIGRLADDSALRNRLGENARRLVVSKYSDERIAKQTIEMYRAVLDSRWPA